MATDVSKWADPAMFKSEKHNAAEGPKAHLLAASADPLGQVAACAKMYVGEVVRDLSEITDEERRHYLAEIQKTKLAMPLEAITMHFMFENVTRAFTHQLVRQRTAAYAQESMRFAVVEDMTEAVALPPSLQGTLSRDEWWDQEYGAAVHGVPEKERQREYEEKHASELQQARFEWDEITQRTSDGYNRMINLGMPAEDARGQMPTNIITRINYLTNFRGLLDHAGNRLCTQAQFEWRRVFAQIIQSMVKYGGAQQYKAWDEDMSAVQWRDSYWQWEALAQVLRPVCYQTGRCAFKADFDRKCSIRARVDANAEINRPSSEWSDDHVISHDIVDVSTNQRVGYNADRQVVFIGGISPREWLMDPAAAR